MSFFLRRFPWLFAAALLLIAAAPPPASPAGPLEVAAWTVDILAQSDSRAELRPCT